MNYPTIPQVFVRMTAPAVSRRFYDLLAAAGLWTLFVNAFKLYARHVKPSRVIYLDGIDGGPHREYLYRWHLLPRNLWFNVYLHKFVRGDDDRALHDHPWRSWSLILDGRYREHTSTWEYLADPADTPEQMEARVSALWSLYSPEDGRQYVDGSALLNEGKFPGQVKLDYIQDFTAGDFRALKAEHLHLLELFGDNDEPCWTLFITGPRRRRWGFACPNGWRDFSEYVADHPTRPNATVGCE